MLRPEDYYFIPDILSKKKEKKEEKKNKRKKRSGWDDPLLGSGNLDQFCIVSPIISFLSNIALFAD